MPITVTPIAGLSDHINDIRIRTARIVNEEILPNEAALWSGRRGEASDEERAAAKALRAKVQARVKSEGLWAPHLPPEYGGMGIDFMAHAYMNEILAYAVGAASLFGVVAPNSGNQTILAKYGTAEQKEKWLLPLVEGTMQSGFSMTEPENAGSDPRSIRTSAVRDGDEWVINGHKWFTSNGLAADFFIVMCRATEPGGEDRPGRMMQVIVPTSTPGVTIVRGIGIWGSASSDHCEVRYDNVRVPAENVLGQVGDGHRAAQDRLGDGQDLPLHELGRPDVAGLRPDGRAHPVPRGARRAPEGQAVHAGLHRRQLHGPAVGPPDDHPRGREGRPAAIPRRAPKSPPSRSSSRRPTPVWSTGPYRCGGRPAYRATSRSPACSSPPARCASPTGPTRCTGS